MEARKKEFREKLVIGLVNSRRNRWNFKPIESGKKLDPVIFDWAYNDIDNILKIFSAELVPPLFISPGFKPVYN